MIMRRRSKKKKTRNKNNIDGDDNDDALIEKGIPTFRNESKIKKY